MSNIVLAATGLTKTFDQGPNHVHVLDAVDMRVHAGDSVAVVGPSGAGKSTLLHLLGGLDRPTAGGVEIMGQPLSRLGNKARGDLRGRYMGFVYQFHHLLPEFDALENVAMPLLIGGVKVAEARSRATALLAEVGLDHRLHHKPSELSGGERQRAAIARALVNRPACLLADEPTGNLDQKTAANVFDMMLDIRRELNTALVLVTHDMGLAAKMKRRLELVDGKLIE